MTTFYVEAAFGGASIIKVEAESEEDAVAAAQYKVADDLNEAGQWRPTDIRARAVLGSTEFDASLVVTEPGGQRKVGVVEYYAWPGFEYAKDDPVFGEEVDRND